MTDLLVQGGVFKKFKHGSGQMRHIWCSPNLDRIMWGEDRKTVKGFESISDLKEIKEVMAKDKHRINFVFQDRLLELESKTVGEGRDWYAVFSFLLEHRRRQQQNGGAATDKKLLASQLTRGSSFKKHKYGNVQIRLIWTDDAMTELYWGEDKRNPKGSLHIAEIVQIISDSVEPCRFTIQAKKRNLELEAMTKAEKDTFINALQAFL